jgi:hypothetical protein
MYIKMYTFRCICIYAIRGRSKASLAGHTHTYTHIYVCIYAHMYIFLCMYVCVHTYAYICMYAYMLLGGDRKLL